MKGGKEGLGGSLSFGYVGFKVPLIYLSGDIEWEHGFSGA